MSIQNSYGDAIYLFHTDISDIAIFHTVFVSSSWMNNKGFQDKSRVRCKHCQVVETHKRLDLQVTLDSVSVSQYCLVLTLHYIGFRSNFQSLAVLSDNNSAVSHQHFTMSAFCNNNSVFFSSNLDPRLYNLTAKHAVIPPVINMWVI